MTMHVNDNGTVKTVGQIYVNDNGVVKQVSTGWINDKGTVKQFYANAGPPNAPVNLRSTAYTDTTVSLAWNAAVINGNPVTGYEISYGTNGTTFPTTKPLGVVLSNTITGLSSNTTYYFRVRANSAAGFGPYSNVEAQATDVANLVPLTPTVNPSTVTQTTIQVRITKNASGAIPDSYTVEYRENRGINSGNFIVSGTPAYVSSPQNFTVGGLGRNIAYEFRVKANGGGSSSAYSFSAYELTLVGTGTTNSLVVGTDTEDVGTFKDLGRGLNSVNEGGGGTPFGSGGPVSVAGFTTERIARGGTTTFTVWLSGGPASNVFSRITLYQNNNAESSRTLATSTADFVGNGGLTGTRGQWTWQNVDVPTWTNGGTWSVGIST